MTMEINKSFGIGLSIGALIVAIAWLIFSPVPERKPPLSSDEIQLVVRFTFNHATNEFDFTFEDKNGEPAKVTTLSDLKNPLNELARGKPGGKLVIEHGVAGMAFTTEGSHCLNSCMGGYCGHSC